MGAKVSQSNSSGTYDSRLFRAIERNDMTTVKYLIGKRIDINKIENKHNPLNLALHRRNTEVVNLLLEQGTVLFCQLLRKWNTEHSPNGNADILLFHCQSAFWQQQQNKKNATVWIFQVASWMWTRSKLSRHPWYKWPKLDICPTWSCCWSTAAASINKRRMVSLLCIWQWSSSLSRQPMQLWNTWVRARVHKISVPANVRKLIKFFFLCGGNLKLCVDWSLCWRIESQENIINNFDPTLMWIVFSRDWGRCQLDGQSGQQSASRLRGQLWRQLQLSSADLPPTDLWY